MFWTDLDPDLDNAIKVVTPEFASSLKRRFTNAGISEEIRTREFAKPAIRLEDTFFKEDKNQITLRDLLIERLPVARLNDISTNLVEKNLRISAEWYNVALTGSYEMTNTSQLHLLPVHSAGNIEIKIVKVAACGLVGFQIYGDALKTTNFNLDFKAEDINVQVEYNGDETGTATRSCLNRKSIDQTLAKYIKRDLYWKLQETFRSRLDQVLVDFSITELFQDDTEISSKYIDQSHHVDEFVNRLVDKFLIDIRSILIKRGLANIPAPDIKTDFSHKFGVLTFWGNFETKKGFIHDLSHIIRTGNFSVITLPTGDFEVWGSLGLPKLQVKYGYYYARIWNIGPWGELNASVGSNCMNFRVVGQIKNIIHLDFIVKDFSFNVVQLEDVRVHATGLSVLLNWLLSYIITWITGSFKNEVVSLIEKQLKTLLDKHLMPT